jgi:hypothetical protein
VLRFFDIIESARWTWLDLVAAVRTAHLAGLVPRTLYEELADPRRVAQFCAGCPPRLFDDAVYRLLWAVVGRECGALPALNRTLEAIRDRAFGVTTAEQSAVMLLAQLRQEREALEQEAQRLQAAGVPSISAQMLERLQYLLSAVRAEVQRMRALSAKAQKKHKRVKALKQQKRERGEKARKAVKRLYSPLPLSRKRAAPKKRRVLAGHLQEMLRVRYESGRSLRRIRERAKELLEDVKAHIASKRGGAQEAAVLAKRLLELLQQIRAARRGLRTQISQMCPTRGAGAREAREASATAGKKGREKRWKGEEKEKEKETEEEPGRRYRGAGTSRNGAWRGERGAGAGVGAEEGPEHEQVCTAIDWIATQLQSFAAEVRLYFWKLLRQAADAEEQRLRALFQSESQFAVVAMPEPHNFAAQERNVGLAKFIESHPYCSASRSEIIELLMLLDSEAFTGRDLYAVVRVLGMQGRLPGAPLSLDSWRVAGMALSPASIGVRGAQRDVVKYTLLWHILENYCQHMGEIVRFIRFVIEERRKAAAAGGVAR